MTKIRVVAAAVAVVLACDLVALAVLPQSGNQPLAFSRPTAGSSQRGNVVVVELRGARLAAGEYVSVFIDRDVVAPGEPIPNQNVERMPATLRRRIVGLSLGMHRLTAIVVDSKHRRVGAEQAETTVTVRGPAVAARTPSRRIEPNERIRVTASVEGLTLTPANGDVSGRTGHLHVIIDGPAPRPGDRLQPSPGNIDTAATEFDLPPLPPGPHRIWIVLTDGDHVVLRPLSLAELNLLVG